MSRRPTSAVFLMTLLACAVTVVSSRDAATTSAGRPSVVGDENESLFPRRFNQKSGELIIDASSASEDDSARSDTPNYLNVTKKSYFRREVSRHDKNNPMNPIKNSNYFSSKDEKIPKEITVSHSQVPRRQPTALSESPAQDVKAVRVSDSSKKILRIRRRPRLLKNNPQNSDQNDQITQEFMKSPNADDVHNEEPRKRRRIKKTKSGSRNPRLVEPSDEDITHTRVAPTRVGRRRKLRKNSLLRQFKNSNRHSSPNGSQERKLKMFNYRVPCFANGNDQLAVGTATTLKARPRYNYPVRPDALYPSREVNSERLITESVITQTNPKDTQIKYNIVRNVLSSNLEGTQDEIQIGEDPIREQVNSGFQGGPKIHLRTVEQVQGSDPRTPVYYPKSFRKMRASAGGRLKTRKRNYDPKPNDHRNDLKLSEVKNNTVGNHLSDDVETKFQEPNDTEDEEASVQPPLPKRAKKMIDHVRQHSPRSADRAPIFQDKRTHPLEIQYYDALEDEIRKSSFLTESVRLVSSDTFRDLVKSNRTKKVSTDKQVKSEQKLPILVKNNLKPNKPEIHILQSQNIVFENPFSDEVSKTTTSDTNEKSFNEAKKWQDYYMNLRNQAKHVGGDDSLKAQDDYHSFGNPSVSKDYYHNWDSIPRYRLQPSTKTNPNLLADPELDAKNPPSRTNSENNLNSNFQIQTVFSDPSSNEDHQGQGPITSVPIHFVRVHQAQHGKLNEVDHEHRLHGVYRSPGRRNEGNYAGNVRDSNYPEKINVNVNSLDNTKKNPIHFDKYVKLTHSSRDRSRIYHDYPDLFYEYLTASVYGDNKSHEIGSTHAITSPLRVKNPNIIRPTTKTIPLAPMPSIDELYNFKENDRPAPDSARRYHGQEWQHDRDALYPWRYERLQNYLPTRPIHQGRVKSIVIDLSEPQMFPQKATGSEAQRDTKFALSKADVPDVTQRTSVFDSSVTSIQIPNVSTESKLISNVLARSNIFKSMASSRNANSGTKKSPESYRLGNRLYFNSGNAHRQEERNVLRNYERDIDRSQDWTPIPSPYFESPDSSLYQDSIIFPSMPFTQT